MKKDWPAVRLGEVLRLDLHQVPVQADSAYPNVGIYSFGRGMFGKPDIDGAATSATTLYRIRDGQLIYSRLFAFEGAYALVPPAFDGYFVSNEFPTFEVDTDRASPAYIGWLFHYPRIWGALSSSSTGMGDRRQRVHPEGILEYRIKLPSLCEQRRIVAQIEELAAQIEEARTLRKQSSEDAVALVVAMAHRNDLDAEAKIKSGWRRARLSEVLHFIDRSERVQGDRSYPNLGIYSFGRGLFHKPPIVGLETSATVLRRVKSGQFIYSRLFAFEGAYGMVTDEFDGIYVSQEYPIFDCDPECIRAEFLTAYFQPAHVWKDVAAGSKGLGDRRQRVQPPQLLAYEIWLPPISWQNRLAEVWAEVDHFKRLQSETAAELGALLPSILDRAFRDML